MSHNAAMAALKRKLDEVMRCPTCGKRVGEINVAGYRQPFRAADRPPEDYCQCSAQSSALGAVTGEGK